MDEHAPAAGGLQVVVEGRGSGGDAVTVLRASGKPRARVFCRPACGQIHVLRGADAVQFRVDGGRKRRRVAGGHAVAGLGAIHNGGNAPLVACDHTGAGRHRLQENHAEGLVDGRPDFQVREAEDMGQLCARQLAQPGRAHSNPRLFKPCHDGRPRRTIAGDQEMPRASGQLCEGFGQRGKRGHLVARSHHPGGDEPGQRRIERPAFGKSGTGGSAVLRRRDGVQIGEGAKRCEPPGRHPCGREPRRVDWVEGQCDPGGRQRRLNMGMARGPGTGRLLRGVARFDDDIGDGEGPCDARADQVRGLVVEVIGQPQMSGGCAHAWSVPAAEDPP